MLDTKERIRPGNGPEDYAAIQRMAMVYAQAEHTGIEIRPSDQSFVAVLDGNIIGTAVARRTDDTHWQLILIYVSGGHRRGGVGRALFDAVVEHVGHGIELQAKATMDTQSYLYQKLNFQAGNEFLVWKYLT
jgi:GNAT superfamily N-acetyltransferase